ncbi:hypothetical protein [Acinetobacter sp. TSRC1-2]|uniref:hypothetical protein n=1 Tax=unclassified Acinetobacter TaxID=196816 RepID=UPI003CF8092F
MADLIENLQLIFAISLLLLLNKAATALLNVLNTLYIDIKKAESLGFFGIQKENNE